MNRDEKEVLTSISLGKISIRFPGEEILSIFLKEWTTLSVVVYDETLFRQFVTKIYPVNLFYSKQTGPGGNTSVYFGKCTV